uniref:DUF8039 domain-containing protein n=1 Tax=Setaria viridis TaxID=4556 RepID=A0A4U6WA79_SETVI|nr:hypothetical protein SEVIR_1G191800v2 [Setaria viridis]
MAIAFQMFKKNLHKDFIKKGIKPNLENKTHQVGTALKAKRQGTFKPDKEKDKLTYAFGNSEHTGHVRGMGVVPWKKGFSEDIESYRSRRRSKAATEEKLQALALSQAGAASCANVDFQPEESSDMVVGNNQHYPMDDIIVRTPYELLTPVRKMVKLVAHGIAEVPVPGGTIHGVQIPEGYARVQLDRVEIGWEDLDLEIPGGNGETELGHTIHTWICWAKRYIRFPQIDTVPASSPQRSRHRSPTPPFGDAPDTRDQSMSTPLPQPPLPKKKNPKQKASIQPPPKQKNNPCLKKAKPAHPKLSYELTDEECHRISMAEPEEPPIDEATKKYFKFLVVKKVVKEPMSDYDRSITKSYQKNKRSGFTIPQLGEQSLRSVDPLKVLSKEYEVVAKFIASTNLTKAQLLGEDIIPNHPGADRDYFRGLDDIWIKFDSLYYLYHQDALDKSLTSAWRKQYYNVKFMDPHVINEECLMKWPNRTMKAIFNFMDKQHHMQFILLSYNFHFHWILLVIEIDRSHVTLLDSKRKSKEEYQSLINVLNKAWVRFIRKYPRLFKEQLHIRDNFPI